MSAIKNGTRSKRERKNEDKAAREGSPLSDGVTDLRCQKKNELKWIYDKAKNEAKKAVAKAKREASEAFGHMVESEEGRQNLFKIAKRMVRNNKENIGGRCLKNDDGKIISGEENLKKRWKEYMEKLLNEENEWDELVDADKIEGPEIEISKDEVRKAIKKMKNGKAGGPSEFVADMLKQEEQL